MSVLFQMNEGQGWTTFLDLFLQFMLDAAFKWKDPGCFLCLASRAIGMCGYTLLLRKLATKVYDA